MLISIVLLGVIFLFIIISYIYILYKTLKKVKIITLNNKNNEQVIKTYNQAPGPLPLPIIGNLASLRGFPAPFEAFTELSKKLGDIYSLTLGSSRCLVVNNLDLIREVLNQNGKCFGGRPDFLRYHKLFGGDRNNSLALCEWSLLQQKRRSLARRHFSPVETSCNFLKMSDVANIEITDFMDKLDKIIGTAGKEFRIKSLLQQTSANMFMHYMCSIRFDYDDKDFQKFVQYFDEIFWEINQSYIFDFIPSLAVFYYKHLKQIVNWSSFIRNFILKRIMENREQKIYVEDQEKDFIDAILKSLQSDENVTRDTVLFMLEDFIGGHSSVGNLVLRALGYIAKNPEVGKQIQLETDRILGNGHKYITLENMENMPFSMATIYEVLRHSSSPIVPHVATEDCVISGYGVTKGTIVIINNFKLNMNEKYWKNPQLFNPERFFKNSTKSDLIKTIKKENLVETKRRHSEGSDSGVETDKKHQQQQQSSLECAVKLQLNKNIPYFLPFSIGRRTCIGKNILQAYSFILLSNIMHKYDISSNDHSQISIFPASVALPVNSYSLIFTPRFK